MSLGLFMVSPVAIAQAVEDYLIANPPTVGDGTITSAKLADMASGTVKGRTAGGSGVPTDLAIATTLKTALSLVKGDVGLGNVDNTSDANKPVSTDQQTALDGKASASHGHTQADLTIADGSFTIAKTTGLQTALDGKYAPGGTDVAVADGGTGASDAATARTNLGAEALTTRAKATGADIAINSTSVVNIASFTDTVAAGDTYEMLIAGAILNNSGGTRTYTVRVTIGATTFDLAFEATIAASATNRNWFTATAYLAVHATNLIYCYIEIDRGAAAAIGTVQADVLAQQRQVFQTSTNNETGAGKTVAIGILSSNGTATQTLHKTRSTILK